MTALSNLIWYKEKNTPDDELIQEVCFYANDDGTLNLSIAHFTKIMEQLGYERIEGR